MSDIATVTVTGRLGRTPELEGSGDKVRLRLRIAVSDRVRVDGEWQNATIWMSATVWGRRAESLVGMLSKGSRVAVSGRLGVREYTTRDGEVRTDLEVRYPDVALLESKRERQKSSSWDSPSDADFSDDEIPF